MKKILAKPHNLLFIASAVIILQFLTTVVSFYMKAVVLQSFPGWMDYLTMAYYIIICVISAIFIAKKRPKDFQPIKIWFAGFFLYAFSEILLFLKLMLEYEDNIEFAYNLFDNQLLYKLYLCISVIFLIYCVFYILEKKKIYAVLAAANLLIFGLFIIFMPDMTEFLLAGDESVFQVINIVFGREIGALMLMLNMFVFALLEFYNYKEK